MELQFPEFEFNSRRSPVLSTKGMVAASQPLAVAAGLKLLSQGGNAADASVAVAAALNVTEPTSTGLGGDCFALYYSAVSGEVSALNGSGRLPADLNLVRLQREGLAVDLPARHPYTITVPGACAGWCDLVERFGSLPLKDILAPAAQLAEEGFPVTPVTAHFWQQGAKEILASAVGGHQLTIQGSGPQAGQVFRNPGLGRTLRRIAEGGKQAFYQGEIAEAIVRAAQLAGGCLSMEDLAAHSSTWDQPVWTDYHGVRVWECPPNGQGLVALLALNLLKEFDLGRMPALSARRLHLQIEALRLAFADARRYIADPGFGAVPIQELLSNVYTDDRRRLIDIHKANLIQSAGAVQTSEGWPAAGNDTVYFSVVDRWGNACSFINSNYMGFGTGIVPDGCGFSLQNRGYGFSLQAGHPNALAPGKRPYHTIIPGLLTRLKSERKDHNAGSQELLACFGVMGGFMQPQGHVQVVLGLVDDLLDPQTALDRPRFYLSEGMPDGGVLLEEGIAPATRYALAKMGQPVSIVRGYKRSVFGRGQIILRDIQTEAFWGGSDPRSDGCAMAYT